MEDNTLHQTLAPPAGCDGSGRGGGSSRSNISSSSVMLPDGPGADATNGNCLACHSADHILNQPSMSRAAWQEIVEKMINAYKAPIAPQDVAPIVDYLVRTKGAK
jgi:hypothetical protein